MMHRDGSRDAHPEDEACEEEDDCSWLITELGAKMQTGQIRGSTLPCLLQSGEGFFLEFDFAYKLRIGGARAELLHPLRLRVATARAPDA